MTSWGDEAGHRPVRYRTQHAFAKPAPPCWERGGYLHPGLGQSSADGFFSLWLGSSVKTLGGCAYSPGQAPELVIWGRRGTRGWVPGLSCWTGFLAYSPALAWAVSSNVLQPDETRHLGELFPWGPEALPPLGTPGEQPGTWTTFFLGPRG